MCAKIERIFLPLLGDAVVAFAVVVVVVAFIFDAHSQAPLIGLILYANDLYQKVSRPKSRGPTLD